MKRFLELRYCMRTVAFFISQTALAAFVFAQSGDWAWSPQKDGIIAASVSENGVGSKSCSDGAGGVFVVFGQYEGNWNLYIQHIAADGSKPWGDTPKVVCDTPEEQKDLQVAPDGAGGVLVVWTDSRHPNRGYTVYAQRLDAYGNRLWSSGSDYNGIVLDTQLDYWTSSGFARITSDGSGGAFITWIHSGHTPTGESGIRAQHINASGEKQWAANGIYVANVEDDPNDPDPYEPTTVDLADLLADGTGGLEVAFYRFPIDNSSGNPDPWVKVFVVNVNASGTVGTPVQLCDASVAWQENAHMIADGSGNVIVAWEDMRHKNDGTPTAYETDIYAQKVKISDGTRLWALDGQPLCTSSGYQLGLRLFSGNTGSAIAVWEDHSSSEYNYPYICANRIAPDGSTQWGASDTNGLLVQGLDEAMYYEGMDACSDGTGGIFVGWRDLRNYSSNWFEVDVYGQHVNASGELLWGNNKEGHPFWYGAHSTNETNTPTMIPGGAGGSGQAVIAVWHATSESYNPAMNITAQKVQDSSSAIIPKLLSITPSSGNPDSKVTILGYHLTPRGTFSQAGIFFNGTSASYDIWSDTRIVGYVTGGTQGPVNVTVQNSRGTSNALSFNILLPAPYLSGVSPIKGISGSEFSLLGTYFGTTQSVANGRALMRNGTDWVELSIKSWSYTKVDTYVPANQPEGATEVKIVTDKGSSSTKWFTVNSSATATPTANPQVTQTPTPTLTATFTPTVNNDACPDDPQKTEPGICGCGIPDVDQNKDGIIDCGSIKAFSTSLTPMIGLMNTSKKSLWLLMQKPAAGKSTYEVVIKGKSKTVTYKTSKNPFFSSKLKPGKYSVRFRIIQKIGGKTLKSKFSAWKSFVIS
ncbi:MAG: hypothetical protein GYA55_14030 [SAR324 cluster bacterium]|uniref:IPT/TIG domain-containing protein n=1 Tax=SAR324 cluster bacterium TaxID=2024889 RepID=A0A7X9FUU2_9DELT|nr:hypothetical protein [SAR324 cluster bacterium]